MVQGTCNCSRHLDVCPKPRGCSNAGFTEKASHARLARAGLCPHRLAAAAKAVARTMRPRIAETCNAATAVEVGAGAVGMGQERWEFPPRHPLLQCDRLRRPHRQPVNSNATNAACASSQHRAFRCMSSMPTHPRRLQCRRVSHVANATSDPPVRWDPVVMSQR